MITISYNEEEEMMCIKNDGGATIFYGNYTDFSREPDQIKHFLEALKLEVQIDAKLKSIG